MIQKLGEAVGLLVSNLSLFSLIVLTVWLPGNLLIEYLTYNVFADNAENLARITRLNMSIGGIFGPLYIGAVIYALSELKQGRSVRYSQAMAVGLQNWWNLFAARFVANLLIVFGLLLFIVPGIILMLRYALLDSAVILERAGTEQARKRSSDLVQGKKLEILCAAVVFYLGFIVLAVVTDVPFMFIESLNTMVVSVIVDCVLDVAVLVITIVLFLYYWEATEKDRQTVEATVDAGPSPDEFARLQTHLEEIDDDDNPYRSPNF